MPAKPKAKKKEKTVLNLSGPVEAKDPKFEVSDYDYSALQTSKNLQVDSFEKDLEYLLRPSNPASRKSVMVESILAISKDHTAQRKRFPAAKQLKVSMADITKDIAGLDFSSDDESVLTGKLEKKKTHGQNLEQKDSKMAKKDPKKTKKDKEKGPKDPRTASQGPQNASSEEGNNTQSTQTTKGPLAEEVPTTAAQADQTPPFSPSPETNSEPLDDEAKERKRAKNARRRARRKELKKSLIDHKQASDTDQEEINRMFDATVDSSPEPSETPKTPKISEEIVPKAVPRLNSKKSVSELKLQFEQPNESPFDVTLRPTKKQNANGTFTSESLPAVYPIKTLIGLSHQQVLQLETTDVKIKTIVSTNTISKFANNVLTFVTKHTDDLFEDDEKKTVFLKLCINVALFESIGFSKTLKDHSQVVEWFGDYDEINLATTGTKLTVSSKNIHQNNFDYSVLSYIGHILIWAVHQQRMGKVGLFTERFGISLSQANVRASVGGYHLWDRLIRESKGMNSKRWKHIIKFRQAFGYEEDQFMLILRFMKVDTVIP